ncbi:hypothetical protein OYC64_017650 [Pagothenia borchgrevinki]|uniref:Uncharacterized protein n=1 Tax=Pagothenia borchgrevinki TaxID=8213 RepID=A0ABD2GKV7_PAGBO
MEYKTIRKETASFNPPPSFTPSPSPSVKV